MNTSSDLFVLIKAMTRTEKLNFKKSTRINNAGQECQYIHLFDYFWKQDVYDYQKFKKECLSLGLVKNYSAEKNYLFKKILQSLNTEHSQDADYQFHHEWLDVKVLFQKGLYDAGFKKLEEMKRKRIKGEKFAGALEVINQMLRKQDELSISYSQKYWQKLYEEKSVLINRLSATNEMAKIAKHAEELVLSCIFEKPHSVNDQLSEYNQRADELIQLHYIRSSQLPYHLIKALHTYSYDDLQKTATILNNGREYWLKQSINYQKKHLAPLLKITQHLMTLSLKRKDKTEFDSYYRLSTSLIKNFELNEALSFYTLVRPILVYHKFFSQRETFEAYALKSESKLNQLEGKLSKEKIFLISYSLGVAFFSIKKYQYAFTHFHNCSINKVHLPYFKELQFFSKIYCAIIHQKNGNKNYSQAEFRSLDQMLKSWTINNSVPTFLANSFKRICYSSSRTPEPERIVKDLFWRLNCINKFHNNCIYLGLDELRCWALDTIRKKHQTVELKKFQNQKKNPG